MKDFIEELLYMCKSSNAKGLYIFITAALCILLLGIVACTVMLVLNLVLYKAFSWLFLILLVAQVIITVGVIIWLKKS